MKMLGVVTDFFTGGHKKSRDFWMATNFNENFVQ